MQGEQKGGEDDDHLVWAVGSGSGPQAKTGWLGHFSDTVEVPERDRAADSMHRLSSSDHDGSRLRLVPLPTKRNQDLIRAERVPHPCVPVQEGAVLSHLVHPLPWPKT